ncbi:hypothetical protein [uncultured Clostridium sp.]|uniref:hypothetical protein n=1 Tax=uncultured Clostridium sp. TaxID=59620 RepID=UPI0025DC46AC|nr:hypothetical protein [uncultured Clostridium sp.]
MRRHQKIKVRVFYPEDKEKIKELKESQANVVISILENQLGGKGLRDFIEYARKKTNYTSKF